MKAWLNDNRLESIKMLLMFKLCNGDEKKWNTDIADNHKNKMIKLLNDDYN